MKKGTAYPNAFIYIIFLVILGCIALFGYYSITTISMKSDQVESIKFQERIKKDIEVNSPYGQLQYMSYLLPQKYDQLCLIDFSKNIQVSIEENLFINITLENLNNTYNAFLISKEFENSIGFKVPPVESNNSITCFNKSGASEIKITMEGKGLTTFIG